MPVEWDLTEEDKSKFNNGEEGDVIQIDVPRSQIYFAGMNEKILIFIFSDQSEISDDLRHKYTFQYCSSRLVLAAYKAIKTIRDNEVRIVLDIETAPLDFDEEEFEYIRPENT